MGESSACLVRSFSQSAGTSSEPNEGDPLRALTTSISFGRFMSEPLAWEKWSSFSNNRYLEEAEKYSKPGSVAEKKAYFEAQYKRIAAKKAAALLEQQNTASSDLPEPNIADEAHNNSSIVSESSKSDIRVVINEMQGKEAPSTELVLSVDANVCDPNFERNKLETDQVEEAKLMTEQLVTAESAIQVDLPNQLENVRKHSKIMSTQQEKMAIMDAASPGNLASTSKKKQSISSPKLFANIRASKFRSSVKLSPVQRNKEDNATQISKKTARDLVEKKRSTPKSLHMSINFSSHARESNKTSPIIHKIGNSKIIRTFVKTSRDSSTPLRTPTRASVNGLSVHPSATPQPARTRSKTLDHQLVSGRTVDGTSQSLSVDCLKPSGASGHKARPPMVASPFSFRCEERAAKRKEFFQKLSAKEAGNVHLQAKSKEKAEDSFKKMCQSTGFKAKPIANPHRETGTPSNHMKKEKAEEGFNKMRQSTGFKAKPIANSHRKTETPSNHIKKISLTGPLSPKLGTKPIPSMVLDTGSRPPRRPSVKIDGSKHVIQKSCLTPFHSINPLLRKNIHENASPNIQL